MNRAEEFSALRQQGLTYREIADQYGVSYQAIAQQLRGSYHSCFRGVSKEKVVFDGLRDWMNDNEVGMMELMHRFHGHFVGGSSAANLREKLRGVRELKKSDIDELIRVTGLSYEELFGRGGAA